MSSPDLNKPILFFDGTCSLCNNSVQWVLKHEKDEDIQFIPLESPIARGILFKFHLDPKNSSSVLFYSNGNLLSKSAAVKELLKHTKWYTFLFKFWFIFPQTFSDKAYDFVAKNRYKWFGKTDACIYPQGKISKRFFH